MTADEVADFERCIAAGGVGLFPADTVYGLAVDPGSRSAVERVYAIKDRPAAKPAAVMFSDVSRALGALDWLGQRTRAALERLLPGPVTVVVANPDARFALACGPETSRLGVRVPRLDGPLEPLAALGMPLLQTSANRSGGADPRSLPEVDPRIRGAVDVELDGGELPGVPSTVIDLSAHDADGGWRLLREGALTVSEVESALGSPPTEPVTG